MNLSKKEAAVLKVLLGAGKAMYGQEIVDQSGGVLRAGLVYITLYRMAEKDLISSRKEQKRAESPGLPRRLYEPKELGRLLLEDYLKGITDGHQANHPTSRHPHCLVR